MRTGPGTDAWLSPPEPKRWRGHVGGQTITVHISRDVPLCGEPADVEGFEFEYEVLCEMDEGSVYSSSIVSRVAQVGSLGNFSDVEVKPSVDVKLTAREVEDAEVSYSEELISREESAREDAADARRDR